MSLTRKEPHRTIGISYDYQGIAFTIIQVTFEYFIVAGSQFHKTER
jgi:hypothetical protein